MSVMLDIESLLTMETNKFLGDKPDIPDNLCCIYLSGGFDPILTLGKETKIERPSFQILIRDISEASAITRIETIKNALHGLTNQTVNGHFYLSIEQNSDILPLGKDSRNRSEFTINFTAQIQT